MFAAPVGAFDDQLHDFNPGIAASGLFWTIPIGSSAIDVDPGRGRARFHAENVPVNDYGSFINSITPGADFAPSHVSFDVSWAGDGERQKIRDEDYQFTGQYVASPTTISFTASQDGADVVYFSDAGGQYNPTVEQGGSGSPAVGHERNGRFFS